MHEIEIHPEDVEAIAKVDEIDHEHVSLRTLQAHLEPHLLLAPRESLRNKLPIGADCVQTERAVHTSGFRPISVLDLQVIHDEEALTALAAASWFRNPSSGGSATYCIDEYTCFRTLADRQIPWGAPGANYHGLHYEQAGYAHWSTALWKGPHRDTIRRTAWKVARDARKYNIKIRWLDARMLDRGIRDGQTSHAECTKAFGGTHTDPGPGYPRAIFMFWVQFYYGRMVIVKPVVPL